MKAQKIWVGVGVGVLVAACLALLFVLLYNPVNVRIGDAELRAKVVVNEPERMRGLSGSDPLAADEAMLFVFPSVSKWGIWMKEMKYPIDIVWLDDDKVVRHIVQDAQPSSYPEIFSPPTEVRYVLEMKSGTVKHKRITIGSRADFDVTQKVL